MRAGTTEYKPPENQPETTVITTLTPRARKPGHQNKKGGVKPPLIRAGIPAILFLHLPRMHR